MNTDAAVPAVSARAPRRMTIANIVGGPVLKPLRLLLYGVDGVGKSTFASGSDAPVFIGLEDGTSTLDVKRFPEPADWLEVLSALDELATADHPYRTVVIDTLDWLEPLCWAFICAGKRDKAGKPVETIEDFGFGKGYIAALDAWRVLLSKLDRLRSERGMAIILIAHSWIKPFKNPTGEDYDRFEIKIHKGAAGLVREWADAVLFATHETHTYQKDKQAPVKGISTGARVMWTQRRAAFDAKNRHDLPETLPLDWSSYAEAVAARQPLDPALLVKQIEGLLADQDPELQTRVRAAIAADGSASALARVLNKLSAMLTIAQKEQSQ